MNVIKIFEKIDYFFLNLFQKFSHWSQKTLGLANFWWSKFCIVLFLAMAAFLYGVYYYGIIHDKDVVFSAWSIVIVVFIFLIGALCWVIANTIEQYCERDIKQGIGNRITPYLAGYRLMCLLLALFMNAKFIALFIEVIVLNDVNARAMLIGGCVLFGFCVFGSLPAAFWYFVSCTPLPPRESKVKAKLTQKRKYQIT